MKINPNNFPYPFLSEENDNYLNSQFNAETVGVELNQDTDHFEIDIVTTLVNDKIEMMLKSGEVKLLIHVECPDTYYNEAFEVTTPQINVAVEKKKISGKLELIVLLVANRDIKDYTNVDFHPDFRNIKFSLRPGNLLGEAFAGEIIIENKIPENVETILKLVIDPKLMPGEFNADYNKNKIYIYLSEDDHKNFQYLITNEQMGPLLYSMVVTPVLVDILYYMQDLSKSGDDISEIEQLDWYKSIKERLNELEIDIDEGDEIPDPLVTANNLIKNPLENALTLLLESGE